MNQSIELIPIINERLNQFKSSIDSLINQNNEYINSIKRYSNKNYSFEKKKEETYEQQKDRIETMLDQLDDIHKRNEMILQNVNDFEQKMKQMKKEFDKLKNNYLNEKIKSLKEK